MLSDSSIAFLVCGSVLPLGIFICLQLFFYRGPGRQPRRILGVIVLLCTANAIHPALRIILPHGLYLSSFQIYEPLQFLLAPLVAAYLRALTEGVLAWKARMAIHALPCVLLIVFPVFTGSYASGIGEPAKIISWTISLALLFQAAAYLMPLLRRVHAYDKKLLESLSNLQGVGLSWIRWFLFVIVILYALWSFLLALMALSAETDATMPRLFLSIVMVNVVWALGFRGLEQKALALKNTGDESEKTAKTIMDGSEAALLKQDLEGLMKEKRPYLDPDLSLSDLACLLEVPRNKLSYIINHGFGRNFYDFVNSYRVDYFLRLKADPENARHKVLSLALDAGFSSKPTFNAVFKKLTGSTPSRYIHKKQV